MPQLSPGNPYRNLAFEDPNGDGMRKAQLYEIENHTVYAQPLMNPGGGFNATYIPPAAQPTQAAPAPAPAAALSPYAASANPNAGVSSTLADLLKQQNTVTPQTNQFADSMAKYLATPAPTAPTAANQFSGELNKYLASSAPEASKATMGENRFSTGLTAAEQRLQDLINNPSALQDSASYKFRVNQGQEALQRSLGAKGMLASGNRLAELTRFGQDMGSQEYEAENARRLAELNSYAGNYNTDQTNNVNKYNIDQGSLDKQYGTAADLYKAKGSTLSNLYGNEATSQNQRYQTAADIWGKQGTTLSTLYGNENQANTGRYVADVGAGTDRVKTLADLYRTDSTANSLWNTNQLGWAENQTKNLDWAYKSDLERQAAMARAQQALGRLPANPGFTTEFDPKNIRTGPLG